MPNKPNKEVPGIPMPRADVKSLNATVMALKEGVETLAGQRGTGDWRALTPQDDISLSGTTTDIDAEFSNGVTGATDGRTLFITQTLVSFGSGEPDFYAPPGIIYERQDGPGTLVDRVFVSNGLCPPLPTQQLIDGATHQYLLQETSGTTVSDTGAARANGTYGGTYTLAKPGLAAGVPLAAMLGANPGPSYGWVEFPFSDVAFGPNGSFTAEFCALNINFAGAGLFPPLFLNGNPPVTNNGFYVFGAAPGGNPGLIIATTEGNVTLSGPFPTGPVHFVVAVYDGTSAFLYCNGALITSAVLPGAYVPATQRMFLSYSTDALVGNTFETYSCVALYSKASTAYQIAQRWNCVKGSPWWSDAQTITLDNANGDPVGVFNAVEALTGISAALNGKKLAISNAGVTAIVQNGTTQTGSVAISSGATIAQNFAICTFQNTGRSTPPNQLYVFSSPDGVAFSAPAGATNPVFTFPSTGGTGTSSGTWACDILYWQGKYWLAYEFDNLSNSNNKFGVANATTLAGPWTWVADVVAVSTTTNATNVWNPRWFLDTDGSVHIIVNVQSGHTFDTAMQPIILDATNAALTAWSSPVSIAGTFPANMIDTFMVGPQQSPNGKYNLWFKDEGTLYIGYMTSSSLKTGYTVTESGNWTGWGQAEGPMLTYLGGAHWRTYLVSPVAGPLTYSDSFDNWVTWTAPAAISTGSISPGTGGIIAHQTGAGSSFLPGAVDIDGVGAAGKYLRGNGADFIPSNILLSDLPSGVGSAPVEQNGTVVASAPTAINFTGSGAAVSDVSGAATIPLPIWAPLVNGDIPGPTAISDGFGQFIMVAT